MSVRSKERDENTSKKTERRKKTQTLLLDDLADVAETPRAHSFLCVVPGDSAVLTGAGVTKDVATASAMMLFRNPSFQFQAHRDKINNETERWRDQEIKRRREEEKKR